MLDEDGHSEREMERREDRAWEQQKRTEDREWEEKKRAADRSWEQAIRRDGMAAHGLRSLLLINGGGAIALLAFLQAIWVFKDAAGLVPWVVAGMIPLLLGSAASGWVHFLRYKTSELYQMEPRDKGRAMTSFHKYITDFAFVMFLIGMGTVVAGVLFNLPQVSERGS